jgi:hypothetical protein
VDVEMTAKIKEEGRKMLRSVVVSKKKAITSELSSLVILLQK